MFTSVTIENFRCFERLELQKLGRINLIVGKNNCGKTSALEAIHLLSAGGDMGILATAMKSRGEFVQIQNPHEVRPLDIRHLFNGREIKSGSFFSVSGLRDTKDEVLIRAVVRFKGNQPTTPGFDSPLSLFFESLPDLPTNSDISLVMTSKGGIHFNDFWTVTPRNFGNRQTYRTAFISQDSLEEQELARLFGEINLTREEGEVVKALQSIEPGISRISIVPVMEVGIGSNIPFEFVVLFSETYTRVPLGNLGDGVRRMLGLALTLSQIQNGYLFVDDIDTGLHYSAMNDMWKMVWETAKRLNVQVFATTHSDDCWRSLATIAERDDAKEDGVSIQRIEKGNPKAINFTNREIVIAAERLGEVR